MSHLGFYPLRIIKHLLIVGIYCITKHYLKYIKDAVKFLA